MNGRTQPMSSPPSSPAIAPLQQVILKKSDFEDESLPLINQQFSNIIQQINNLLGVNGTIRLNNHVDLGGNRIQNVGDAVLPTDAVSQLFGNSKYGPAALAPSFEALGKNVMQTYRRLSDPNQREKYSSFLNQVLNTAPTSNTSAITFGSPGGGTVSATVTAGFHQRVDGSQVPYAARTDTLSLPTAIGITSLTRSGNIVTAVTSSPDGLSVGEGFSVKGATDPTFDGAFSVLTVSPPDTFTYFQGGANTSTSSGSINVGGVYYYTLSHGQNTLGLVPGSGADTWSSRIAASNDGTTIIAVEVLNWLGGDVLNSAAGATAPQSNVAVPVIRRL